jgi:hypothetical protein
MQTKLWGGIFGIISLMILLATMVMGVGRENGVVALGLMAGLFAIACAIVVAGDRGSGTG